MFKHVNTVCLHVLGHIQTFGISKTLSKGQQSIAVGFQRCTGWSELRCSGKSPYFSAIFTKEISCLLPLAFPK